MNQELHELLIYGASDDLVELEGFIREEYYLGPGDRQTIEISTPDEDVIWITATFCADPDLAVGWVIAAKASEDRHPWPHPVTFTTRPGRDTDPAIRLLVPTGTDATSLNGGQ